MLLDLQLPDGDGLDLLDDLRRSGSGSRVIVITANGSINRAVQAMRAGAFDFLVKPFDETRLVNAVENALASAPVAAALEPASDQDEDGYLRGLHRPLGGDAGYLPNGARDRPIDGDGVHHR